MDVHKTLYPFYTPKKIPHVTRTVTRGAKLPLENFCHPLEKCVGYGLKLLDTVQKCGSLSENSSPLLVSQAGYGPARYGKNNKKRFVCSNNQVC